MHKITSLSPKNMISRKDKVRKGKIWGKALKNLLHKRKANK